VARRSISVVVPAYNEADGIVEVVGSLRSWLERNGFEFEIVVVDNASEDGTAARLEPLLDDRVRLLRNDRNRGKGYSVRRGMLAARGALRLHCDADCTVCLPSLPGMLELIEHADVVVGSRLAPGARLGRRQPLWRRFLGRGFQQLCRLALREPTTDLYCGFKLWRAEAAVATYSRSSLDGWVFDAEVLALARALGYRLRETGIVWTDREGSRVRTARVFAPALRELAAARHHVRREAGSAARRAEGLVPEAVEPPS
jgi:dolichyl-phosphate beta-glucosyltransferase